MKTLYLDLFAGISGDMLIGALIDLGVEPAALEAELHKLPLSGYRLEFRRVEKNSIQAVQFRVLLQEGGAERLADSEFAELDPAGEHLHLHSHHPAHSHPPESDPPSPSAPADHPHALVHRGLAEIRALIENSALSAAVKSRAVAIFERLAEAESQVHGLPVDQIHFHEVGGVDAILDITGAAVALELLGIDEIIASPVHLGSGFVSSAHGRLPVPAPATANLLLGVPTYSSEARGELVTPTGAAILAGIAGAYGPQPLMQVRAIGYGAGTRDREFPNVVRAFLGERLPQPSALVGAASLPAPAAPARGSRSPFPEQHQAPVGAQGYHSGPAVVIEANIDDMNPQFFEPLLARLLEAGALDVMLVPVQMKKGRPGVLLHVLAHPSSVDDLLPIIFAESTSIGVRTYPVTKRMLQRELRPVDTPYGPVRVKLARLGDRLVNIAPEYEDCRELAARSGVPLKEIYAAAQAAAQAVAQMLKDQPE